MVRLSRKTATVFSYFSLSEISHVCGSCALGPILCQFLVGQANPSVSEEARDRPVSRAICQGASINQRFSPQTDTGAPGGPGRLFSAYRKTRRVISARGRTWSDPTLAGLASARRDPNTSFTSVLIRKWPNKFRYRPQIQARHFHFFPQCYVFARFAPSTTVF